MEQDTGGQVVDTAGGEGVDTTTLSTRIVRHLATRLARSVGLGMVIVFEAISVFVVNRIRTRAANSTKHGHLI